MAKLLQKRHYLPQFYLRGFATPDNSTYQIEKATAHGQWHHVSETTAVRDYCALGDAKDIHTLEKLLAKVEMQHSEALAHVVKTGEVTPADQPHFIEFLSFVRLCAPACKAVVKESLRKSARWSGPAAQTSNGLPPALEGLESALKMDMSRGVKDWMCLIHIFKNCRNKDLYTALASMNAYVRHVPRGASLLTSDQPVAVYHPKLMRDARYTLDMFDPDIEISFPLTGQLLLHMCWGRRDGTDQPLTPEEVDEFNRRTVIMADALVFAGEEPDRAREIVAKHGRYLAGFGLRNDSGSGDDLSLNFWPVMTPAQYEAPRPGQWVTYH